MFRFGSWVFSAVQRSNRVNGTNHFIIRRDLQERADVRQFAASPAIYALALSIFGNGQHGRKGPFDFCTPGIRLSIIHAGEHTIKTSKSQASIRDSVLLFSLQTGFYFLGPVMAQNPGLPGLVFFPEDDDLSARSPVLFIFCFE